MSTVIDEEMVVQVTKISNNVTIYHIDGPTSFGLDICWYLNDQLATVDSFVRLDSKTIACITKIELDSEQQEPIKRLFCKTCNKTIRFVTHNGSSVVSSLKELITKKLPSLSI